MPADMPIPSSPEHLVRVVTDNISAKFPDLDRAQIQTRVQATYQRLAADSRISDHLAVLVQHETIEHLRASTAH
jgi:hypothetical protein